MTKKPVIRLGLTGSIGMGKSTVAKMFADLGVPVWDADEVVHRLYATSQPLKDKLCLAFGVILKDNSIDRARLSEILKADPSKFAVLDAIVHPLVREDRAGFMETHRDSPLVLADIPLLYETGSEKNLDYVLVVSAPPEVQKARVMARPGMTEAKFNDILSRQISDAEKRQRANFLILTDQPLEATRAEVAALYTKLIYGNLDKPLRSNP
ncbi:dephospho-CoA kinase [Asticcacaulis sp. ZE23SCel15]|uniref:dephospho-CoA kinase n=1 Tax=Asticcacaulis sp. ZE23SCel15 TaxID=3059027 RepID=UPI00265FA302|nr:dephospho-CoA kinase [Asticcacaulis sp. ZE23SCel15]WKL58301.1 dephospho-CoA kinase [Asticcacaulis sp. ZE23SCel15]